MTAEIKLINQTDGLPGLWRGLYPSLCRTVPGVGLYFASMHWMRNTVCEGKPSALQSMMIGCTARTFAGSVMIPFTVVKTRMESGTYQYRSVTAAITHILRNEGVRGLARGLGPTLVRDVPFSSAFSKYYSCKSITPKNGLKCKNGSMGKLGYPLPEDWDLIERAHCRKGTSSIKECRTCRP